MLKSTRRVTTLIVHLAIVFGVSQALASDQPVLQSGARVRATLEKPEIGTVVNPKVITGTLLGLTETSLTLERSTTEPPIIIPLQNLASLELNTRQGRRKKGALIGLCAGVATGVLTVLVLDATHEKDPDNWEILGTKEMAVISGFYLGSVGALVGALVAPGARWQPIPSDQIQLGVGNNRQGEGRVYFAVRF